MLKELKKEFWSNVYIPGEADNLNVELDKAIHLRDFILMGELIAYDALHRNESCGGHFREEYQTEEGEAKRDDAKLLLRRLLGVSGQRYNCSSAQQGTSRV